MARGGRGGQRDDAQMELPLWGQPEPEADRIVREAKQAPSPEPGRRGRVRQGILDRAAAVGCGAGSRSSGGFRRTRAIPARVQQAALCNARQRLDSNQGTLMKVLEGLRALHAPVRLPPLRAQAAEP